MSQAKMLPATTQLGMPALRRPPAMTRDRLVRLAKAAVPILTGAGAVNTAAICDAYLAVVVENDLLRRQLDSIGGWGESTRQYAGPVPTSAPEAPVEDVPQGEPEDWDTRPTAAVEIPETTLTMLKAVP